MKRFALVFEQVIYSALGFGALVYLSLILQAGEYGKYASLLAFFSLFQTIVNPLVIDRMFVGGETSLNLYNIRLLFLWLIFIIIIPLLPVRNFAINEYSIVLIFFGWTFSIFWVVRRWAMANSYWPVLVFSSFFYAIALIFSLILAAIGFDASDSYIYSIVFAGVMVLFFSLVKNVDEGFKFIDVISGLWDSRLFLVMAIMLWMPINSAFIFISYDDEYLGEIRKGLNVLVPFGTVSGMMVLFFMRSYYLNGFQFNMVRKWVGIIVGFSILYYLCIYILFFKFDLFYKFYGSCLELDQFLMLYIISMFATFCQVVAAILKAYGVSSNIFFILLMLGLVAQYMFGNFISGFWPGVIGMYLLAFIVLFSGVVYEKYKK